MKVLLLVLLLVVVDPAFAVRRGEVSQRKEVVEIEETWNGDVMMGSGVVIDPHVIVTNGHIASRCNPKFIKVFIGEGKSIRPDAVECGPMRSFYTLGRPSTAVLASIGLSQDIAFLIFKEKLHLPVADPDWSGENRQGKDAWIVGFGPLRKRLEGKALLTHFQASEYLRLILEEANKPTFYPVIEPGYIEVVTELDEDVMIEKGDSGGGVFDDETGKLLGINVYAVPSTILKKDFGGIIYINSPTFRERVRMVHRRYPYTLAGADPVLKAGSERAKLERRFMLVTDETVRIALEWYEDDLRKLPRQR